MSLLRIGRRSLHRLCAKSQRPAFAPLRNGANLLCAQPQWRSQHNSRRPPEDLPRYFSPESKSTTKQIKEEQIEIIPPTPGRYFAPEKQSPPPEFEEELTEFEPEDYRVRYLRPAIWCFVVSGGIFTGLAYYQAREEVEQAKKSSNWLQAPQWSLPQSRYRGPPTATELATRWWADLDPISKVTWGIVGANGAVHLSSFVVKDYWRSLWHRPILNRNYTHFTSMFVHSGYLHFAFNMLATCNFMPQVGYSRLFEGNAPHIGAFFLATGILSGYAQHLSTLVKTAIPPLGNPLFTRSGGASGALFGILGAFCVQYPNAELGILFIPVRFEAQYFLPAVMLFDAIGVFRGYPRIMLGHAVSTPGDAMFRLPMLTCAGTLVWCVNRCWIFVLRRKQQPLEAFGAILEEKVAGCLNLRFVVG